MDSSNQFIACVAIIGKQDEPIIIRSSVECQTELMFHFLIHSSITLLNEKVQVSKTLGNEFNPFLGLISSSAELYVYGYITKSNLKFICITYQKVGEELLQSFFKSFHELYVHTVSNPFTNSSKDILTSNSFINKVDLLIKNTEDSLHFE
ncbi:hypothetical protein WA158_002394 [Blastocystis sp. Blastoise]